MENGDIFVDLYQCLKNQYLTDPIKVTESLEELYSDPNSFLTLMNLYEANSDSQFLKKSIAIGLKRCVCLSLMKLGYDYYCLVLNKLFGIILKEDDYYLFKLLMLPIDASYSLLNRDFNMFEGLIDKLVETNQIKKCLVVLISFMQNANCSERVVEKSLELLKLAMEDNNRFQFSDKIVYLYLSVILLFKKNGKEIDLQNTSKIFSCLFNDTIIYGSSENVQDICNSIVTSVSVIDSSLIISFPFIIETSLSYLLDNTKPFNTKLLITDVLGYTLDDFKSIELDLFYKLFNLCIELSIASFNEKSVNDKSPDLAGILICSLLKHVDVPIEETSNYIKSWIKELIVPNDISQFFVGLLLIQCVFFVDSRIIEDINDYIIYIFITALQVQNESLQSIVANMFESFYYDIEKQIEENFDEIFRKIADLTLNHNLLYGLDIIPQILINCYDIDPYYDLLFSIWNKYYCSEDFVIVTKSWLILTLLVKYSKNIIRSNFDYIYDVCFSAFRDINYDQLRIEALHSLISLSENKSCSDLMKSKIDDICDELLKWYDGEDARQKVESIQAFQTFFKNNSENMGKYVPYLSKNICNNCCSDYHQKMLDEIHENNETCIIDDSDKIKSECFNFASNIISNELNLLAIIIKKFPNLFLTRRTIIVIFECIKKGYENILNQVIIGSNRLFSSILKILKKNNISGSVCTGFMKVIINIIRESTDVDLITSGIKAIYSSLRYMKNNVINLYGADIFRLCLNIIDQINVRSKSYKTEPLYLKILNLMCFILRNTQSLSTFITTFISDIFELYNNEKQPIRCIAIEIFTLLLSFQINIFNEGTLENLLNDSLYIITNNDYFYGHYYIDFIINLFNSNEIFLEKVQIQLIDFILKDVEKLSYEKIPELQYREYLLRLFVVIDNINSFVTEDLLLWFTNYLPIKLSLAFNPLIYTFLMKYINIFQESELNNRLKIIIVNTFINQPDTLTSLIKSPSVLIAILNYSLSNLCNLTEELYSNIFNKNDELYQSFIETIQKIIEAFLQ